MSRGETHKVSTAAIARTSVSAMLTTTRKDLRRNQGSRVIALRTTSSPNPILRNKAISGILVFAGAPQRRSGSSRIVGEPWAQNDRRAQASKRQTRPAQAPDLRHQFSNPKQLG